jgi:hypothetical protein
MTHNETITLSLTGNGLVFERTEKPGGKVPWWWVRDERRVSKAQSQTYRHRETLKAYGCRWSKKRRSWYYIGAELPEEIAALVGPQDNTGVRETAGHAAAPAATVPSYRESYQARVLRRFAEQFQADLERLNRYPSLPAIATIRLDDPWA